MHPVKKSLAVLAALISLSAASPALAGGHGWGGHGGHWGGHGGHWGGWHHYGYGYVGGPSVYFYSGPDWGWDYPYDGGWGPAGVAPYPGGYPNMAGPEERSGEGHYCATPSRICELPPGGKIGESCSCPLENGRAYGRIHN